MVNPITFSHKEKIYVSVHILNSLCETEILIVLNISWILKYIKKDFESVRDSLMEINKKCVSS